MIASVSKKRWLAGAAALALGCAGQLLLAAQAQAADASPATAPFSSAATPSGANPSGTTSPSGTTPPATAPAGTTADGAAAKTPPKGPVTADALAAAAAAAPAAPLAEQLLGDQAFYIEADTLIRDDQAHTWTARGSVEIRYAGRTLRADEVVYNANTDITIARGNVQVVNADGTYEYAQVMTLDKGFHTGVAVAFSAHQQNNVTLASAEAIRRNQDAIELNRAVFTACNLCAKDQTPKEPTWSIQASQIVQDPSKHLIYYRNAFVRIEGLPVMYTPVFWHPDPTAKRGSGFLEPSFIIDSLLGFSYTQPYLWVISPSQELIVAPQVNTKVNPVLEGEYRERFYSGQIDARFGYTYENEFDDNGSLYGGLTSRSYILGEGAFAPSDDWTYGFTAERVTDPLMFQRYSINNVYEQRGLYATDNLRLISQGYGVEQTQQSYISIAAVSYQGLQPGDLNGTFPTVAPLVEARYEPSELIFGGTLRMLASGVLLDRSREVLTDAGPNNGSERATASVDWSSNFNLANGMRFQPFVNGRFDEYNVLNLSSTQLGDYTTERLLGTVGVDASYPFFKRQGDMTIVLEPLVQLALSPSPHSTDNIPNEDSQSLSFDETNLFDYNKSSGFDYYEMGQRLNFGGRATLRWDSGGSMQVLVGQSLRAQSDPALDGTSLNRTASDWVVAVSLQPINQFSGYTRALVNQGNGQIDRLEVGMNINTQPLSGYVRFLSDSIDTPGTLTENMQAGLQMMFTPHWGITTSINRDIANDYWVTEAGGVVYQDECIRAELDYERNGTINGELGPSNVVLLRVTLPLLGGKAL